MTESARIEALQDLLTLRKTVPDAVRRLHAFPWDSEVELITLSRIDGLRALDEYLQGRLSSELLEQWAHTVEGRDDIGFEMGFERLLKDFIFELATPDLTRSITARTVEEWKLRLE